MKWRHVMCDWEGPEGRRCGLRQGHGPLKAWPHHAPDRLFYLGPLLGTIRYPFRQEQWNTAAAKAWDEDPEQAMKDYGLPCWHGNYGTSGCCE